MQNELRSPSNRVLILYHYKYYIILRGLSFDSAEEYYKVAEYEIFEKAKGDIVGLPYLYSANSDRLFVLFSVEDKLKAFKGINYSASIIIPSKRLSISITADDLDLYKALNLVNLFVYHNSSPVFNLIENQPEASQE